MDKFTQNYIDGFMAGVIARNPGEKEFHQAVREVVESVAPYITAYPHLLDLKIMERMVEPERVIIFRVPWMDDRGGSNPSGSSSSASLGWTTGAKSRSTAVSACR